MGGEAKLEVDQCVRDIPWQILIPITPGSSSSGSR